MHIRPFRAIRPRPDCVARVASVPYDTVNTAEARSLARDNELSFLHVIRPEIDLPDDVDPYSAPVYQRAVENYQALIRKGTLVREDRPSLYLYRQKMGDHVQTGVVCCCHIDDYATNRIRRHEEVRTDKLADRTALIAAMDAHAGPVFLAYRDRPALDALIAEAVGEKPLFDFTAEDGVAHTVWRVAGDDALARELEQIPVSYVADGHHRAASAVNLGLERRRAGGRGAAGEEANWFLAVMFPAGQLRILSYNRCVQDLNGLSETAFLERVRRHFEIRDEFGAEPPERGWAAMYLGGRWYGVHLPHRASNGTPVLDADLLQSRLLKPLLGINDPRTDTRIRFVGGIRGTAELERRVDSGGDAVAFSMFPVSMEEVMTVADAGGIMPPKSTWFEPKLRSGLLIHSLAEV